MSEKKHIEIENETNKTRRLYPGILISLFATFALVSLFLGQGASAEVRLPGIDEINRAADAGLRLPDVGQIEREADEGLDLPSLCEIQGACGGSGGGGGYPSNGYPYNVETRILKLHYIFIDEFGNRLYSKED